MEKLIAFHVAAQLTVAACGGSAGGSLQLLDPANPTKLSPAQQAQNLRVWETFRVFYAAVIQAFADKDSWKPPTVDGTKPLGTVADILAQIAKSAVPAPVAAIIDAIPPLSSAAPATASK